MTPSDFFIARQAKRYVIMRRDEQGQMVRVNEMEYSCTGNAKSALKRILREPEAAAIEVFSKYCAVCDTRQPVTVKAIRRGNGRDAKLYFGEDGRQWVSTMRCPSCAIMDRFRQRRDDVRTSWQTLFKRISYEESIE